METPKTNTKVEEELKCQDPVDPLNSEYCSWWIKLKTLSILWKIEETIKIVWRERPFEISLFVVFSIHIKIFTSSIRCLSRWIILYPFPQCTIIVTISINSVKLFYSYESGLQGWENLRGEQIVSMRNLLRFCWWKFTFKQNTQIQCINTFYHFVLHSSSVNWSWDQNLALVRCQKS